MLATTTRRVNSMAHAMRSFSTAASSQVDVVLGSQWGDEGKGKLADVLAGDYDVVARFNGGNNAGHTVKVGEHKFAFHLLPCGLVRENTRNLLGNGTVVHLASMFNELAPLDQAGISWKNRLFISDRAHLLFDFHQTVDGLLEQRRQSGGGSAIGTTKKGIGPAYSTKALRIGVRAGDMRHRESYLQQVRTLAQDMAAMYELDLDVAAEVEKADAVAERAAPMVVDGVQMINSALQQGKRVLAEGANAAMLDQDMGTYPFVTSSSTTAGGVCTGLGVAPRAVGQVWGVAKAYTTRVGGGPFPTELTDARGDGGRELNGPETDIGLHLQEVGGEIGVTTKRKRRCGWLDAVVLQYSNMVNGYHALNLTKLDVLDDLPAVKIGVAYKVNGERLPYGTMPSTLADLSAVEVEYEELPGWQTSLATCKTWEDLPAAAQAYIARIEELVGVPVKWVGVGPGRDDMVNRN